MNETAPPNFADMKPPEPLTSDYIEIVYLIALFLVGAPLNLAAYTELREQEPRGGLARMHLLKRHLNYSDLLVLMIYVPSEVCWLITYDWRGGIVMCKVTKFIHSICFQGSSNVIVCIALDRLMTVLRPSGCCSKLNKSLVLVMLVGAWSLAVTLSIPQLFVWTVAEPFPKWNQCVTTWTMDRWMQSPGNLHRPFWEQAFLGFHIFFVFWIPLVLILISYMIVGCWLNQSTMVVRTPEARSSKSRSRSVRIVSIPTEHRSKNDLPEIMVTSADESPRQEGLAEESSKNLTSTYTTEMETTESQVSSMKSCRSGQTRKAKNKAIQISCLLVSIYVICWLPYQSLSVWRFVDQMTYEQIGANWDFLHGLVVFNSVINPFFYGMFGTRTCRK